MNKTEQKLYPTTFPQLGFITIDKYSLHKQLHQLPIYIVLNQKMDFELLRQAFNVEIKRNDCLRLRFKKQKGEWFQYFRPAYEETSISFVDFLGKTEQEQYDYFAKDAGKPVYFKKDEVYRIIFFTTPDGNSGIYFNVCHLIMDGSALFLFLIDMLEVYNALANGTEMPSPLASFELCLQKDVAYMMDLERQKKDSVFFDEMLANGGEPIFTGVDGPNFLEKHRNKKKNPIARRIPFNAIASTRSSAKTYHLSPEFTQRIYSFCAANNVSVQTLLQFGIRMFLAKENNCTEDVLFEILCSRRPTLADRGSGGCRVIPIPYRTIFKEELTAMEALQESSQALSSVYRHADLSYYQWHDSLQRLYGTSPLEAYSSVIFNHMQTPQLPDKDMKLKVQWVSPQRFPTLLYSLAFKNFWDGGIDLIMEYRLSMLKEEHLDKMFDSMQKVLTECIENPQITLHDILHKVL